MSDGGSAFPVSHDAAGKRGMTLRDYFAAKAIGSILAIELANATAAAMTGRPASPSGTEELAALAYSVADAMLAERAKA